MDIIIFFILIAVLYFVLWLFVFRTKHFKQWWEKANRLRHMGPAEHIDQYKKDIEAVKSLPKPNSPAAKEDIARLQAAIEHYEKILSDPDYKAQEEKKQQSHRIKLRIFTILIILIGLAAIITPYIIRKLQE
jgi:cell division protein FtsN